MQLIFKNFLIRNAKFETSVNDEMLISLSGTTVFSNTDTSVPPEAIGKVFTETG